MGSPETCEKCGGVGRHVEGKRGFTRFPCPNATPTPPAPADDARPMVVGGAFVKFDRPAPAPDAGWEPWGNPYPRHPDVIRTRDLCLAICEKHQAFDAAAEIRVMHLPPAPDAGAAEDHPSEASRDHGADGSDRAVVEALRDALERCVEVMDEQTDAVSSGGEEWDAVLEQARAALRGTPRAKRGGDQPKAGHEAEGREGA